jgi:Fibronectin type III domain
MQSGSDLESRRLTFPTSPEVSPTRLIPDPSRWIPSTARRLRQAFSLLLIFILFTWSGICQAQSSIQIAWDPNPEPDIAGYYVYLGDKATDLTIHKIIRGSTTGTLTGLLPSTTYYVAVQAFNSAGLESGFSTVIPFTTRSPGAIIAVEDAAGIGLYEGDEISAGNVQLGSFRIQTFTLKNLGTTDLTGLLITSDGPQAQDFAVSGPEISSLSQGSSADFTVTFTPSAPGYRTARFHIASNDALTPSFGFSLVGNSGTDTQLYAQWAAAHQLTGNEADPLSTPFGDNVKNLVKYASNLAGNRPDTRYLASSTATVGLPVFTLDRSGPSPVFKVEFLRRNHSGLVYTPKISSNLSHFDVMTGQTTVTLIDENWSRVVLRKTIDSATTPALYGIVEISLPEFTPTPAPEIAITDPNGSGMKSNSSVFSFGTLRIGGPDSTGEFTITNEGNAPLTGIALILDGPASNELSVSNLPKTSLAVGESMTFTTTYRPNLAGIQTSTLRIVSNDSDESTFGIALNATSHTPADLFANWTLAAKLAATNATTFATPFQDSVTNLLKYAFNLDATRSDTRTLTRGTGTAGLPAVSLDQSGPLPQLVIEFLRRKNSGLIYTPEISPGLANFQPLTETPTVTSIDDQWDRVVLKRTIDPSLTPTLFGRVSVTLP